MEMATTAQTVLFYIACIASGLFILKIIIMFIGGDFEGAMLDFESDAGDSDGDFGVFSLNSIACFFMGFGWVGLASLKEWGFSLYHSLALGFLAGTLATGLLIGLLSLAKKLNHEPSTPRLSKGDTGDVYSKIPAYGIGKIRVNNKIVQATSDKDLESFTRVRVLEDIVINTNAVAKVTSI